MRVEMTMPRNLKIILAGEGSRGINIRGTTDRHSIASLRYAIKACPVPMPSMSEIGGFDENIF
jgi:hypothetical protein